MSKNKKGGIFNSIAEGGGGIMNAVDKVGMMGDKEEELDEREEEVEKKENEVNEKLQMLALLEQEMAAQKTSIRMREEKLKKETSIFEKKKTQIVKVIHDEMEEHLEHKEKKIAELTEKFREIQISCGEASKGLKVCMMLNEIQNYVVKLHQKLVTDLEENPRKVKRITRDYEKILKKVEIGCKLIEEKHYGDYGHRGDVFFENLFKSRGKVPSRKVKEKKKEKSSRSEEEEEDSSEEDTKSEEESDD